MGEKPHILRMSVDQHQQPGRRHSLLRCTTDSTQRHLPGSTSRHPVSHHPPRGNKKPRHLFGQQGKQRRFITLLDLLAPHHRNRHRQMANVGLITRTCHYHLIDRIRPTLWQTVSYLLGPDKSAR